MTLGRTHRISGVHADPANAGSADRLDDKFHRARLNLRRAAVFAVLDLEPSIANAPGAKPLAITNGVIEFENVSFGYAGPRRGPSDTIRHQLRGAPGASDRNCRAAGQR